MKKIFSVGNICLFVAALVLTFGTGLIVNLCHCSHLSCVMSSAFAGVIGTMAICGIAGAGHWDVVDSPAAGLIATIVGMVLVMLFF
jgi:hypothetical protein